jgi:LuxR family maltose regulon positive regulatory protein
VALDAAGRRQLYDYLATEVLQSLPAPLVDFLLRCAVLGEWTAERCAAVADDARAATWLDAIEQRDLFVGRRDGEPPCWVPDPLFREFLEDQLRRRRPDELPLLLDRAAATEPDAARRIEFMLRAGRPDHAAQALLECAPELLGRGGALQVQRLLERFPAPARDALPAWHFVHGQLDWFAWDWPALDGRMRQAQRGFADAGQPQLALAAAALHTLALAGRGELLAARDAVQALAAQPLAAADRAVLEVTRAWVSAALGPRGATAEAIDGTVDALLQADAPPALWLQCLPNFRFATMPALQPAVERFVREAMRLAGQESTPLRMGARMLTAWRLLWRGDAAAAQLLLDEVADDARWHGMPRALHWSVVCAQATVHGLAGRAAEMHALCELMLENFPVGSPWRRSMLSYWLRLTALVGDHARWAQIYPLMRVGIGPAEWPYVLAGARLADGQDALLQGDAAAAEPALCEAAEALADIDTVGLLDTAQALLALARLRQQRGAAAVAALTPVLRRIAEGGDPLGLTLVGPVVLDELAAAWPRGAEPALDLVLQREGERARQWQAATLVEARTAGTPAPATTDDPLSPRERMVLERIAAGDSNKLIARALNLSPHTVKRHVANILDKLGLATRAQAAAWLGIRAR